MDKIKLDELRSFIYYARMMSRVVEQLADDLEFRGDDVEYAIDHFRDNAIPTIGSIIEQAKYVCAECGVEYPVWMYPGDSSEMDKVDNPFVDDTEDENK